ncbi:sialic acid-binding Ig-like lectin 7 isoform X1 [Pleurodeles waltl]
MERDGAPHGYWYIEGQEEVVASDDVNKEILEDTRDRFRLVGNPRKRNCSLSINDIRKSDGRDYYFKYENNDIKLNFSLFPLHINVVDLQDTPDMFVQDLIEGKETKVFCRAPGRCSGTPPNITWNMDSELEYEQRNYIVDNAGGSKTHMSRIIFNATRKHNNKSLKCTANFSSVNRSTTNITSLNVEYPPSAPVIRLFITDEGGSMSIHKSNSVVIQEGVTYTILCTVDSNPPANLTWMKGEYILEESNLPKVSNNLQTSLLNVTSKDIGSYRCEAVNKHGSSRGSMNVTAQSSESRQPSKEGTGCATLSIEVLVAIMVGITLVMLLLVVVSFCVIKTIKKKSKVGESNMKEASDNIAMDSIYQELQGQQMHIYSVLKKEVD